MALERSKDAHRRMRVNRIDAKHGLRAAASVGAAAGALAIGACGEDESSRRPEKARALAIEVTEPSPGRFRYSAPRSVPAGLYKLTLRNAGKRPHKAQLMRVEGGHSVAEAVRARRPLPPWLTAAGGVGVTAPGATASVTQRLFPGSYYVTGSGGERGRVASLEVVGRDERRDLARTSASIAASEYRFTSSGLRAGRNAVEFRDDGFQPHHAVLAPIRRGATFGEVVGSLRGERAGPPPIDIEKAQETAVLEEGQRQIVELHLRRGRYAVLCFVSDRAGGPPHVRRGMVEAVTVP